MTRAIALLSGGLDSRLAVRVIQEQGIEVTGVNFITPFFGASPAVRQAAEQLGVPLRLLDITDAHWQVVKNPKHGYGKNMNPCIDCHALMIREAGRLMEELGADFIITGEVLGQRPKSQNLQALQIVERESGYPGLVLRPLSARLLPPTIPEQRGLVDRERLLDISGRSRQRQMELAKKYGITDYPSPAGGCILTDPGYSQRLRQLFQNRPEAQPHEARLLRYGRLFFLPGGAYLLVGRREEENRVIAAAARPEDLLLTVQGYPGPTSLLRLAPRPQEATGAQLVRPPQEAVDARLVSRPQKVISASAGPQPAASATEPGTAQSGDGAEKPPIDVEPLQQAAAITARYSDAKHLPLVKVAVWHPGQPPTVLEIEPAKPA